MRKHIVKIIILILCFNVIIQASIGFEYATEAKNSLRDKQIDGKIPTWVQNDNWIYQAHIYSNTENGVFDLNSDDLTIEVIGTSTIFHNEKYEQCYEIDLSGSITGTIQSSIITGDITGQIIGNASMRQSDLSIIKSNISISGIIEYLIIFESDFFMENSAIYFPRFEYFDFPLNEQEKWNTSTKVEQNSVFYVEDFFPEEESQGNASMDGYAESLNIETITVPAGTFDCYHLNSQNNGSIESWYAPDVKSLAKMFMDNSNETEESKVWMNLTSYTLNDQDVTIDAAFVSDIVNVSESATVQGTINKSSDGTPVANKNLNIHIPYVNRTFTTITDTQGFFSYTFTAPLILDPTNTTFDIGSDGIIISLDTGTLSGYRILTLTVIGIAIDEVKANPQIQYETLDVNISCKIYSVEDVINKTVMINGPVGFTPINVSLQTGKNDTYYYTQSYTITGLYSYYIWTKNNIGNENTTELYNFSIIEDTIAPVISNITAQPNPQWETYPVNISCEVTDNVNVDTVYVLITDPLNNELNVSMTANDNTYFYNSSYSVTGTYSYQIWAEDTLDNVNSSTVQTFVVNQDIESPVITNIRANPNPQFEFNGVNITCTITDNVEVNQVKIIITDPLNDQDNITMNKIGDRYYFDSTYNTLGNYTFNIWANDTLGNSNFSTSNTFQIIPDIPRISNIQINPNPQIVNESVNISCSVSDNLGVDTVKIHIDSPNGTLLLNETMNISNSDTYFFNNNYSQNGSYSFFIWANDTSGYVNISPVYTFEILNQSMITIDLSIESGWNLISVPVDMGWNASDLAASVPGCLSVSRWDQFAQSYYAYFVGGPDSFDYVLEPGYGYFVEASESSVLSLSGPLVSSVSVPLEVSWDLIGWFADEDSSAKSLSENITGCLSVSKWDSLAQSYYAYFVGGPDSFDFVVSCGMGLFVEVDVASIWHGEG